MPLPRRRPPSHFRAAFETLESRQLCATIVVTNTNTGSWGSLFNAVRDAAAGDVIDARGIAGTITLATGEIPVNKNLTILGPGSDKLTITNAGQGQRAFNIGPGLTVRLSGMTIDDSGAALESGGGILVQGELDTPGKLTLNDVAVSGCVANSFGGGLSATYADVTMTNCRFTGNTLSGDTEAVGGGVYLGVGSLIATNCTFDNNVIHTTGDFPTLYDMSALGGGVALLSGEPSTFTNCTFYHNTATADVGTVDGSTATALGGGLVVAMYGNLTVLDCTFAGNALNGDSADTFGGGLGVLGFGSDNPDGTDVLKVVNTILAGNTAAVGTDAFGLDVSGYAVPNLKNNVIGVADDSGIVAGDHGNVGGTADAPLDAMLGPLADNGGLVPTTVPADNSPAIGVASASESPRTDARGYPRSGPFDAGAYEKQSNYAPTVTGFPDDVARADAPFATQLAATDVDGDPVSFSLLSGPAWLSITDNGDGTATLAGTPSVNDVGDNAATFRATDGNLSWDQPFNVAVGYDPVALSDTGVLRIAGTDAADVIHVWQPAGGGGAIRVAIGKRLRNYSISGITAIQIFGRGGDDTLIGNCVDLGCYVQAGDGNDTLIGGDMADSLTAAAGDDVVMGMGGDDWIDGNGGRDNLDGGDGNDRVYGGNGRDVITGGNGSDVLYGEVGPDLFMSTDRTRDWIFGGEPDINFVQGDIGRDILYDATLLPAA